MALKFGLTSQNWGFDHSAGRRRGCGGYPRREPQTAYSQAR